MKTLLLLIPLWIVREEIIQQDIKYPNIAFAQFLWETGHGRSRRFLDENSTHGWETNHQLKFSHWRQSIKKYKDWQNIYLVDSLICDSEEYFRLLKRKWGAPNMDKYVSNIKIMINQFLNKKPYGNKSKRHFIVDAVYL